MTTTCRQCRFWKVHDTYRASAMSALECRKGHPVAGDKGKPAHPLTEPDHWCGEFEGMQGER